MVRELEGYKKYRILILEQTKLDSDLYVHDIYQTIIKLITHIVTDESIGSYCINCNNHSDESDFFVGPSPVYPSTRA